MSTQRRFAAAVCMSAFLSVACLDIEPPQSRAATPRPTTTPTFTPVPAATEPTRTATPTSTVTPTFTPSPTITPTPSFGDFTGGGNSPVTLLPPVQAPGSSGAPAGFPSGAGAPFSGGTAGSAGGTVGGTSGGGAAAPVATAGPVNWQCNGDERIDFIPPNPVVGDDLTITVSSGGSHGYVQLQGPLPFDKIGEGRGGPGYYWQWKKRIEKIGLYTFDFYSGPRQEYRCVSGQFQAATSAAPTATAVPKVVPTATPSSTPRPDH